MTNEPAERVALIGATGAIGNSVVAALRQQGRPYRAIGRSRAALEKAFGRDPLAEIATWDPDSENLSESLSGQPPLSYIWLACPTRIFIFTPS